MDYIILRGFHFLEIMNIVLKWCWKNKSIFGEHNHQTKFGENKELYINMWGNQSSLYNGTILFISRVFFWKLIIINWLRTWRSLLLTFRRQIEACHELSSQDENGFTCPWWRVIETLTTFVQICLKKNSIVLTWNFSSFFTLVEGSSRANS